MLRIINIKLKSKNLIKDISKKVSDLTKLNKDIELNKEKIQKNISEIHFKLNEFEYIQNLKPEKIQKIDDYSNSKIIKKKLKINHKNKKKQSDSFIRWLINNREI